MLLNWYLYVEIYDGKFNLLMLLQEYVKKFQTEAPQIQILHEQMVDIT